MSLNYSRSVKVQIPSKGTGLFDKTESGYAIMPEGEVVKNGSNLGSKFIGRKLDGFIVPYDTLREPRQR